MSRSCLCHYLVITKDVWNEIINRDQTFSVHQLDNSSKIEQNGITWEIANKVKTKSENGTELTEAPDEILGSDLECY